MELDYAKIDPELLPALEDFPALDLNRGNIAKMRKLLSEQPSQESQLKIIEETSTVLSDGIEIPVFLFKKTERTDQPAIIWIHGGGYVFGSAYDERARVIADFCDCTVISVEYRLAPEHPFPAGTEDCMAVLEWVHTKADTLNINPAKIAIAGASAGAGMAAGVSLMNRDTIKIPLCFQLLLYPMLDNLHATASGLYTNHPVWKRSTSFNAWEMYLNGTPGEAASPYAAPSRAKSLEGLPPTYISVGSEDLFRDEDLIFGQRLITENVPCEIAIFPGMYHAGEGFAPTAKISKRLNQSFLAAIFDALN